jgi:hypothetical protein
MPPSQELVGELLGDRASFDQARQKSLAEQLHDRRAVPACEGMESAIVRESAVGDEQVTVWMPLDQVSGGGDGRDDSGPSVRAGLSPHVLGYGLDGTLGEVKQELPALAEDPAQEERHGEDDMTMGNGLEHLLLQPLRPQ